MGKPDGNLVGGNPVLLDVTEKESLIEDRYQDLLERETRAIGVVATTGPDGAPQANPVWFDWDGTHFIFSQLNKRQKYKNLKRDPKVAICIVDPSNPYRYLEIRGEVDEVVPDPDFSLIDDIARKYTGAEFRGKQVGDERYLLKIRPIKTSGMG